MCNRFTKNRGKFNIYSKNRGKTASRRGTRGKGVKPGLAPPKPGRLVSLNIDKLAYFPVLRRHLKKTDNINFLFLCDKY